MKFIDEKGKLFGKINIIDFSVILFFLCILPLFYFGYKIVLKRYNAPQMFIETEINCRLIKVKPEILRLIKVGDKEIDKNGAVIAEITWLGEVKPHEYEFNIGGGEKITKEDQELKDIFAKIKLKAEIRNGNLYYKNNLINIDSPIQFNTDEYALKMIPAILGAHKKEDIYIEIDCRLIKVKPEILRLIKVGDKEIDKNGAVIAEITWLGEVKPHEYEFNIGGGEKIKKEDQELKDIFAKIKLKAEIGKLSNILFYRNERFMVNFPIGLHMENYNIQVVPVMISKKENLKEKWVRVKVKLSGIGPELSKVIQENDTGFDPTGREICILRKIISNKPSEVLITKETQFITINHPFLRDINIILDLIGVEKEGTLYFNNYPIKIGNALVFTTDLYSITGTITDLEIK